MAMHRSTHAYPIPVRLVKKNMFVERTEYDEKTPASKLRMGETARWTNQRMFSKEKSRSLNRIKIAVRNFPTGINRVPFKLPFNVCDEKVRFPDAHDLTRERTLRRRDSKSS